MKVSGFTFLRNGSQFGYPFVASIRSALPIVDEFVVALGPCEDDTEEQLLQIRDPKLRVIRTTWNERIRNDQRVKGFVYGQQKSVALFNCTGDWALYLEGDEVLHEQDYDRIRGAMERHLADDRVEAMIFDYRHFYGNTATVAWSPRWYRTAPRILRNTIPAWAPKGLFFIVLETHKRGRYPRAVHCGGTVYHYGWVRPEDTMNRLKQRIERHWSDKRPCIDYGAVDPATLRPFTGTHPAAVAGHFPEPDGLFRADPAHVLTRAERKHRLMMRLERACGLELSKKHYRLVHPAR